MKKALQRSVGRRRPPRRWAPKRWPGMPSLMVPTSEIKVFITSRDGTCGECGAVLSRSGKARIDMRPATGLPVW